MTNIETLTATLEHIETNPHQWSNLTYRHQGTACFAARAALIAGYKWKRPGEFTDPFMLDHDGHEIHCRTLAVDVLGLRNQLEAVQLFNARNTLEDLRHLVTQHAERAEVLAYAATGDDDE